MKIAILVNCLTGGGAERVASLWANGFLEQGHDVEILIREPDRPITYRVQNGIRLISVCPKNKGHFMFLRYDIQIRSFIKSSRPDVLICLLEGGAAHAKISLIGLGVPIIQTEHNSFQRPSNRKLTIKQRIYKFICNKYVSAVTVLSQADKTFIGQRLKNVYVLPNPLPFKPVVSVPPKHKIIMAAGRFDDGYYKGFDILLKSYSIVSDKYKDWHMLIAGGGSNVNVSHYKQMAKDLGLQGKVSFTGYVEDIIHLYQDASVFVLSSRYEGFGMVLIEAMSQGCACIACDYHGRQEEIITDGFDGLICRPDDVMMLSEKIELLITNQSLREKIQRNAVKRSKYYEIHNIMCRWNDIIGECIRK